MPFRSAGGGLKVELRGLERLTLDEDGLRAVLRSGVQRISRTARKRLRGRGRTGRRYRKNGRTVTASRPSEAPAQVTGTLAKSVRWETNRGGLSAVSKLKAPHTHFLFLGTKYIEPRVDVMAEALEQHDSEIQSELAVAMARSIEAVQ